MHNTKMTVRTFEFAYGPLGTNLRLTNTVEKPDVFSAGDKKMSVVPTNEIYLRFKEDASQQARESLLHRYKLLIKKSLGEHKLVVIKGEDDVHPLDLVTRLQCESEVVITAEPDLATSLAKNVDK